MASSGPATGPSAGPAAQSPTAAAGRDAVRARLRQARALRYVAAVLVLAYLVWTVPGVRPAPGFEVLLDGVLQGSAHTVLAILALVWAVRTPAVPAAWAVAGAVVLRATGYVLALTFVGLGDPLPYPSVADLAWVGSTLLLILAVVLRVRDLAPRLPLLVVLDAVGASLLLVGTVVLVLADPIRTLTATPGVVSDSLAVNLVHPVIDVTLLIAVAALVSAGRRRLTRADQLAVVGIVGGVVVDVVSLVLLAEGPWRPGNPLAGLSVLSTAALAVAVGASPGRRSSPRRLLGELPPPTPAPGVAVPATMVTLALLGLTFTSISQSGTATLAFAAGAMVAVARGVTTFDNDRTAANSVIGTATADLRQFQALVEASTDLIAMADAEGNVLYLNPAGRLLLGMAADRDPRTISVAEIVPGSGDAAFATRWPLLLQQGFWKGEAELLPVDSSAAVPVAISTFVMRDSVTGHPFAVATIQRDISDVRRQKAALQDIADQRARLLNRLVQAQEAERAQIAAEVHDDSVQALAVVDLRLGVLRRRISRAAPELADTVDDVQAAVSAATDRLRHLLFDLESPAHEIGLRAALTAAAEVVFADTDVDWQVDGPDDLRLGDAERITAYRVAREAMVNARKHADPTHVTISLAHEAELLVVSVSDDGPGFTPGAATDRRGHLGLSAMHDRASVAGGDLRITTPATGGTTVLLSLPVPR